MLPRQGIIAALLNTHKLTQEDCQNWTQRSMAEKEQIKTPEKEIKNGDEQYTRCKIQSTSYKIKELSKYFKSIKKSQEERKDILMEMNNLQ